MCAPISSNVNKRLSLSSARSRGAKQAMSSRLCRRRRAKALRTIRGAASGNADFAGEPSMKPTRGVHFSAENPIGPCRIAENERDQHGHSEQHE
jgi:hypothetical protein